MKFFIAILMDKTRYYKEHIPNFSLDRVLVASFYTQDLQKIIYRLKFSKNTSSSDINKLSQLFFLLSKEYPYAPDCLVYPPIHILDLFLRGKNHMGELVKRLSFPYPSSCPFRKRFFSSHQSRKRKEGRKNIQEELLFNSSQKILIQGKKILLFDDCITTGYTAHTL